MDPYHFFNAWMRAHGYADVCDAAQGRVDLARLDAAVAAYARHGAEAQQAQREAERRGDQWQAGGPK